MWAEVMTDSIALANRDQDSSRASFVDEPSHPKIQSLVAYWTEKRGSRLMPSRADIKPHEIKPLLPHVQMWSAEPPYVIRLTGEHVVQFDRASYTGEPAVTGLPPSASKMIVEILSGVVRTKAPLFRAGKAYWSERSSYRDFEACYLPLSEDGVSVNVILGGYVFDMT